MGFDIFGTEFKFRYKGKDPRKKTSLGFVSSLLVIALGIAYLIYLLYEWLSGNMSPKVVVKSNTVSSVDYTIQKSPIMIRYYTANQEIIFNEYFNIIGYLSEGDNTKSTNTKVTTIDCSEIENQLDNDDIDVGQYFCIQPTDDKGNNQLNLSVDSDGNNNFVMIQSKFCNDASISCKDISTEIFPLMQKPFFKIEVLLVYYEYDITNKELAQRTQKIQLPGDYSNIGYYTFYVEVSKVSEDNGWFWSSITEREYISGYTVDLQVMEPSFLNQKVQGANTDVYYSFFKFELQLKQTETIIEHPKLSEVLASFGAIFSIIMYIGLIAQMNSEAQIYGDMVNVYLKEYCRKTGVKLQNNTINQNNQLTDQNEKPISLQNKQLVKKSQIKPIQSELQMFKRSLCPRRIKQCKISNKEQIDPETVYNLAFNKVVDSMNVQNLFQEIYRIKTAMQIILSPQQYAALGYVGRSIPELNMGEKNPLEFADEIDYNPQLKDKLFQEFLKNFKDQNNQENDINTRIYKSLLDEAIEGEFQLEDLNSKQLGQAIKEKECLINSETGSKSNLKKQSFEKEIECVNI